MQQWSGKRSECDYNETKVGSTCKLPLIEQLFLTLVRIPLNLPKLDCAVRLVFHNRPFPELQTLG